MKSRDIILKKLGDALDLVIGKLWHVMPDEKYPIDAEYLIHSRLIVVLSGEKNAFLPLDSGRENIHLSSGDMLYCLPKSWELHEWKGKYEMLCIVPRKDYLRVSLYINNRFDNIDRPAPIFHHTGLPYPEAMRHVLGALNSSWNTKDKNTTELLIKSLISISIYECGRKIFNPQGQSQILYDRMRNWIANSFQENISRDVIAKVFGVSSGYVSQLFKRYSGQSFQDFLTLCRMDHARELLETTNLNGNQIAYQSGYNNYVHFVRHFRERNGLSPQKYRTSLNQKN
ncbi:MAG: AraC family transcriptional regulator [Kiritimatiellae bacterium]|jgi:AraC-like DNA-binding protein|nr:AraC family transcriptional regulator [Kiritimatiellia bacterium]